MDLKDVLTGAESIEGAEVKEGTLSVNRGLGVGIWSNWRRWRHGLEVTCVYLNHINPAGIHSSHSDTRSVKTRAEGSQETQSIQQR